VLRDASQTGVNWLLDLVRERDRSTGNAIDILNSRENKRGNIIGSLQDLNAGASLGNVGADALDAGVLTYGVLTDSLDFRGAIAAEVQSRNAEILANPVVVTVENKKADISIVQDFPYQEITQSTQGPPVSSTAFKEIGIQLSVTPRVTHEKDIIVALETKQSSISGLTEDGIPIEDKRTAQTTLRSNDGKTIFIGGLRNIFDRNNVSKIPVLGDVPVINFMFRNTDIEKIHTELLIFLTIQDVPRVPDSQRAMFRQIVRPGEMRDPAWKWRRTP
jgi:type II secretory pathway component GspD/PulD (secretin)